MECNASDLAQEVYKPLIGTQYRMLCSCKNGRWQIGTGSIRLDEKKPTVYLQIESWLAVQAEKPDNILVLTTRKDSATSLRSFCHQSRRYQR